MAFVITDVTTIAILATILIVVYIAGTYWKHRTLTSYAHWFQDNLSKHGKVQFASHGHAGLRVRCETGKNRPLSELHFALSLGARENLLYYALAPFTRDFDRIDCWAVLHKPIGTNLRILKQYDRKGISNAEKSPNLTLVESDVLRKLGYLIFASNSASALGAVSKASMPTRLGTATDIETIEVDRTSSKLHVVARLKRRTLPQVLNFIFDLGNSL